MSFYRRRGRELPEFPETQQTVVLDVDETLVHTFGKISKLKALALFSDPAHLPLRRRVYRLAFEDSAEMWGVTRPHVDEFLHFCFAQFRYVVVWSAGAADYVQAVVRALFRDLPRPHLVLTREDCEDDGEYLTKPLAKVARALDVDVETIHAVDDRETTFAPNAENGILVARYKPAATIEDLARPDDALLRLKEWFASEEIAGLYDVRGADKSKIFAG